MRLSEQQARERMAAAAVARLATVDGRGQPHLVPITFAVDGERIYTAVDSKPKSTTDLKRLRNIVANPLVTVLADHYDDDWPRLWWVRADGLAAVIDGCQQRSGPVSLLTGRYDQYRRMPPTGPVIAVTVTRWTGWSAS